MLSATRTSFSACGEGSRLMTFVSTPAAVKPWSTACLTASLRKSTECCPLLPVDLAGCHGSWHLVTYGTPIGPQGSTVSGIHRDQHHVLFFTAAHMSMDE